MVLDWSVFGTGWVNKLGICWGCDWSLGWMRCRRGDGVSGVTDVVTECLGLQRWC